MNVQLTQGTGIHVRLNKIKKIREAMKIARTYSRIYAEEELQFYVVQNISRLKSSFKRGEKSTITTTIIIG